MKALFTSLALSLVVVSHPSYSWDQRAALPVDSCKVHAQYGVPQATGVNVTNICRQAYLVGYDAAAKDPKYVTYTLESKNALGCVARTNAFATDQSIKDGATPSDYAGTGYDKGHQAPDGDLSWDTQVEYESFLMTNMAPQAGSLNRGIWKLLETSVRGWAVQTGDSFTVDVAAGYNDKDKKIGKGVVVPHSFAKVVIDNKTKEYAVWLFPHVEPYPNLGNDLTKFRSTLAAVEKETGVKFAVPAGAKELPVGKEWPVDFGKLTKAKRDKCGANASDD